MSNFHDHQTFAHQPCTYTYASMAFPTCQLKRTGDLLCTRYQWFSLHYLSHLAFTSDGLPAYLQSSIASAGRPCAFPAEVRSAASAKRQACHIPFLQQLQERGSAIVGSGSRYQRVSTNLTGILPRLNSWAVVPLIRQPNWEMRGRTEPARGTNGRILDAAGRPRAFCRCSLRRC